MSHVITLTSQEITHYLLIGFSGPLIVSTVGFIIYGINCYQFCNYTQGLAKKDPWLTKSWVLLIMLFNSAGIAYQVYFNWLYSIESFTSSSTGKPGTVNGNTVVLYSVVVMLSQMFWIICVDAMRNLNPNLGIISPITLASFCSFSVAIAVSALSTAYPQPRGAWPSPTVSILLRIVLSLDLGVDLSILTIMISQLRKMKKEFNHLEKPFSKLTYIFVGVTTVSTCIIIAELIINAPQSGEGNSFLKINLTFAPVIPPLYTLSILSVLNSRDGFWTDEPASYLEEDEEDIPENPEDRGPEMNTNEVRSNSADRDSRPRPPRNHAATMPADDVNREYDSMGSSEEFYDRQDSDDGNSRQGQSFGIQTI